MTTTRGGANRVELFRGQDGLWYFRRVARNNEIVASSEGYQNRADAVKIAHETFPDVAVWINQGGAWMSDQEHEDETELEGQTVTEGEEVEGEPEFLPEPEQEDAPDDAEEGPEPDEPPVEA